MRNPVGQSCPSQLRLTPSRPDCLRRLSCVCALMATLTLANAAPILDTGNPTGFFTNVASRLLSSELNIDLTRIQIYPTNQYTPAVHRLLQVAANIYDATTNRSYDSSGFPLPTLFQPVFQKVINGANTEVYITNFVEFTALGASLTNTTPLDLGNSTDLDNLQPFSLVYGVPIIVGAKKGLPNFNQFAMQSAFAIARKLQITRVSTNATVAPTSSYKVNQMFNCSVSNQLAFDFWNSYTNDYTRQTTIWVADHIQMGLTNDETQNPWYLLNAYIDNSTTINNWPGIGLNMNPGSFQINNFNVILLPTAVYQFRSLFFTTDLSANFETNVSINGSSLPQPHWWLVMTNNIQAVLIDTASGRAIDYVQLRGPTSVRDLTAELLNSTNFASLWLTNIDANSSPPGLPSGVNNQIFISMAAPYNPAVWGNTPMPIIESNIDGLRNFYHIGAVYNRGLAFGLTNLQIQVGYTPSSLTVQRITWQANDPLVHYLNTDLTDTASSTDAQSYIANPLIDAAPNERYQPWGIMNQMNWLAGVVVDANPYNIALKDPLVWQSDDWDFPNAQTLNPDWLGQVHRGTPWQTIYLKASDVLGEIQNGANVGTNTWMNWTGDFDPTDAAAMAPVRDWHMVSMLAALLNTNDLRSLFSLNNPNPNAWLVLLDGLTALTNDLPDSFGLSRGVVPPQFGTLVISSNSPQASAIVNAIQSARMGQPGQLFRDVGDILVIPQLTEQSPFLNWNDGVQSSNGISDEAYEMIPSQLLPLLRSDSIGSIAPTNSQMQVQFTGYDGHAYAVQISSDLMNWVSISTNCPVNGTFNFMISAPINASQQFYRSVLLQ